MRNIILITPLLVLLAVVTRLCIETRKDYIYDNIKCKRILVDEIINIATRMNKGELSLTYRVTIAGKQLLLYNKLDRRVLTYYKNNRRYVNGIACKILSRKELKGVD